TKGKKLADAAKSVGLELKESPALARGEAVPPFDSRTISRIFELKAGEPAPQALPGALFVSLKKVNPPRVPDLAEVKDRVKADLSEQKAMAQARARAADVRSKAAASSLEKAATASGL